jgi:hypothetical protein
MMSSGMSSSTDASSSGMMSSGMTPDSASTTPK